MPTAAFPNDFAGSDVRGCERRRGTAALTEIDLAAYNAAQGAEGSEVVSLMTDSGGRPGSSILEQRTITRCADEVYALN